MPLRSATALFLLLTFSASPALALTVTNARVNHGAVEVSGKQGIPGATLTWEGQVVGQVRNNGSFSFKSTVLPPDCMGEVGDGSTNAIAVVAGCGPAGVSGAVGPRGPGAVLKDSAGTVIGVLNGRSAEYYPIVYRSAGGTVVHFQWLGAGDIGALGQNTLYYPGAGCSGPAMTTSPIAQPIPFAVVMDQTLYYPTSVVSSTSIQSRKESFYQAGACTAAGGTFTAPDLCCLPNIATVAVATTGAEDLGPLVRPFHAEVE